MNPPPHLLVCISGHGYGHVAQTAPVLNALSRLVPDLRLTVRTSIPSAHLKSRIAVEFHHIEESVDPGMEMHTALEVDTDASMRAYARFHENWERRLQDEAQRIAGLSPDLVLSNVAYLPLAGAARKGIPAIAMCSLNWADIFHHFCADRVGAQEILQQIEQAYLQADTFLRLTPAMPMPWLKNQLTLEPVAQRGSNRRPEIDDRLKLGPGDKLVLASMGGIGMELPVERWPALPGVFWLVPDGQGARTDMRPVGTLGMEFSDIIASCDLLLTKPGYGSFVEAASSGVPVLYAKRGAWPEQDDLIAWLQQHGRCGELPAQALQTGQFAEELRNLLDQPRPMPVLPVGTMAAAELLAGYLTKSARSISMASP
ncbi:MAG TPA: hypothetical protein VFS17_03285 [Methylophilaceae bacterium]|nr:hypothetical protein [Methylophilaceae bacterium]